MPLVVHGQTVGQVSGRVLDQTGAALAGVTIEVVVDGNVQTAITNDRGEYRCDCEDEPEYAAWSADVRWVSRQ